MHICIPGRWQCIKNNNKSLYTTCYKVKEPRSDLLQSYHTKNMYGIMMYLLFYFPLSFVNDELRRQLVCRGEKR